MRIPLIASLTVLVACGTSAERSAGAQPAPGAARTAMPGGESAPSASPVAAPLSLERVPQPENESGIARSRFYHLAEGSELYPLTFLRALVAPDGSSFMSQQHLESYGMLFEEESEPVHNPEGLPIGMTLGTASNPGLFGFRVVGFNCAACHVGELHAEGRRVRLDGAPNMLDIKRFNRDVGAGFEKLRNPAEAVAFFKRLHALPAGDSATARGDDATARGAEGSALRRSLIDGVDEQTLAVYRELPSLPELKQMGAIEQTLAATFERIVEGEFATADSLGFADLRALQIPSAIPKALPVAQRERATPRGGPSHVPAQPLRPLDRPRFEGRAGAAPELMVRTVSREDPLALSRQLSPELVAQLESDAPLTFLRDVPRGADPKRAVYSMTSDFFLMVRWVSQRLALLRHLSNVDAYSENTAAGPGRVDAFVTARNMLFGPEQAVRTESPICFPHLWGFGKVGWLHWDANTTSVTERNIGQSLGLGAVYDPKTYRSSVDVRAIRELELYAAAIPKPHWPFAKPAEADRVAGEQLFGAHCQSCHAPGVEQGGAPGIDTGTDPTRLETFNAPVAGEPFATALAKVLRKIKTQALRDASPPVAARELASWEPKESAWRATKGYAKRSLEGIWASAPYLHNGSVPSLEQLLTKPEERMKRFQIGSRAFDVEAVGYVTSEGPFTFDTAQKGNGNGGHAYGTELSAAERRQLIAYLKTL